MKRRRRHDRLKRITTRRAEDRLFFAHGTFPRSAVWCAMCSCGARSFSRDPRDRIDEDFHDVHVYCDEDVYA